MPCVALAVNKLSDLSIRNKLAACRQVSDVANNKSAGRCYYKSRRACHDALMEIGLYGTLIRVPTEGQ